MHSITRSSLTWSPHVVLQLSPRPSVPELFALHLPREPASQTVGGADLWPGRALVRIEPYGVVRFDLGSLNVNVQEPEDREAEVSMLKTI